MEGREACRANNIIQKPDNRAFTFCVITSCTLYVLLQVYQVRSRASHSTCEAKFIHCISKENRMKNTNVHSVWITTFYASLPPTDYGLMTSSILLPPQVYTSSVIDKGTSILLPSYTHTHTHTQTFSVIDKDTSLRILYQFD